MYVWSLYIFSAKIKTLLCYVWPQFSLRYSISVSSCCLEKIFFTKLLIIFVYYLTRSDILTENIEAGIRGSMNWFLLHWLITLVPFVVVVKPIHGPWAPLGGDTHLLLPPSMISSPSRLLVSTWGSLYLCGLLSKNKQRLSQ